MNGNIKVDEVACLAHEHVYLFIEEIDSENTLYCISLNICSSSSNPEVTQSNIRESYSTLEVLVLQFSDHIQTIVMIISS